MLFNLKLHNQIIADYGVARAWLRSVLMATAFFAAISLYFTIFLPYWHEEGRYSLATIEMSYHHYYWQPTNYGHFYHRPPLYNWLCLPFMYLLGPQNILVIGRVVSASASVLMGLVLWFFVLRIYKNSLFALFTVGLFFSGDFLFRGSWSASPDTLYALCTFTGIVAMWLAFKEKRPIYWWIVPFALFAAMLSKALTAYAFYFTALLVVWVFSKQRSELVKPASILAHAALVIMPLLWFILLPHSQWHDMVGDISSRAVQNSFAVFHYCEKVLLNILDCIFRLAPVDLLAFYCWYKQKKSADTPLLDPRPINELAWIFFLSVLPYGLSMSFLAPRYVYPILPFAAIIFGYYIWNTGIKMVKMTVIVLVIELICKTLDSFIGVHWYDSIYYKQQQMAQDILQRTQGYPLFTEDLDNGFGIAISSYIDTWIWPKAPLLAAPVTPFSGCVMSNNQQPSRGQLLQTYNLTIRKDYFIYLYCNSGSDKRQAL